MITKKILFYLAFVLLFVSCSTFEPEVCQVSVEENPDCTYKLEQTSVPKGSFVKLQVIPNPGFELFDLKKNQSSFLTFHESSDEENTFCVLASDSEQIIKISLNEKYRHYIYRKDIKNGSISVSKDNTFEGDTVSFTVTPDKCFYYEADSVKVHTGDSHYNSENSKYEYLNVIQSSTNPNEYSFIMPEKPVIILAETKFAISAKSQKNVFSQGEKIIFNIENKTPEDTFDIKLSDNFYNTEKTNYKTIAQDVKLSKTYELPQNILTEKDTGSFTLHIYPHGENYAAQNATEATAQFTVNIPDVPEGWTTVGIKNDKEYLYGSSALTLYLSNVEKIESGKIIAKYILEKKNSSEKINASISLDYYNYNNGRKYTEFWGYTIKDYINNNGYDTMTLWIEDEYLKFISRKITVDLKK